jgi:WD40-like Beta Propeller Repeat
MRARIAIALLAASGCNALLGVHGFHADAVSDSDGDGLGDGVTPDNPPPTCNPANAFDPPQPVPGSSIDDGTSNTFVTDIDAAGTTIYLASDRNGGALELYAATRGDPTQGFGPLVALQTAPKQQNTWITISPDGSTAITVSDRGGTLDLFKNARIGVDTYNDGNGLSINTGGIDDTPRLTRDGQMMYFSSNRAGSRDLYVSPGPSFLDAQRLEGNGMSTSNEESAPALTRDQLVMYFTRGDAGTNANRDVYMVTRGTLSSMFQDPTRLDFGISTAAEEIVGAVSPDNCALYFTRIDGPPLHAHPYVAIKPN